MSFILDLLHGVDNKPRQIHLDIYGVHRDFLRVAELSNGQYGREAIVKLETLFTAPHALMNYGEAERMKKVLETSLPILEAEEKRFSEIRRNIESICIAVSMQAARR